MARTSPAFLLALVIFLSAALAHGQGKRPLRVADLLGVARISNPALSPDGKWVAYIRTVPDTMENKNKSTLWAVSTDGGISRQLTSVGVVDGPVAWSPDAKRIAVVAETEGMPQVWAVRIDTGGPAQVSRLSTGASDPAWSPDGNSIAYVSAVYPAFSAEPFEESDALNKARKDETARSKVKARVVTQLLYRHWNSWVDGNRKHIFVQPLDGGDPQDLTPGDRDAVPTSSTFSAGVEYDFSPDGKEIAYTATPIPVYQEAWSTNHDIYVVPTHGGAPRQLTTNAAADGYPRYSPDGKYIAYRAQSVPGFEADRWQLMLYERSTGKARSLTETFDGSIRRFVWSPNGRELFFESEEKGNRPVFSVSTRGNDVRKVLDGAVHKDISVAPDGNRLCFTREYMVRPREIYAADIHGKNLRALTRENEDLLESLDIPAPESIWFTGADGTEIQAWVLKPPSMVTGMRYPLVYLVHGGPQNAWLNSWHYRWNLALWAAQGYVVMAPNPRGSTGFGQKFVNEITGDWGGRVFRDLLKGLDHACSLPFVDSTRKVAAGASFGGYMMNWFQGHLAERFQALITHAGVYNLESTYGTTDETWFDEYEHGGMPWESPEQYRTFSPHVFARNFRTPTLILHGERDFRVPISEGMQLFTALQRQGVPSKLVWFPDEGHHILKPANSIFWHACVFDWLARYLKADDALYKRMEPAEEHQH